MPVQQGNDEAERPLVAPVKAPGLLIRAIAMVSVILVMVAFVLGFRLGGAGAPGTLQVVQATATGLAAPSTTASPTVPFAAVSDALRRAYRAAGAGSAICVVDGAPGCQKMGYNPSDRVYQPFAGDATISGPRLPRPPYAACTSSGWQPSPPPTRRRRS